MDSRSLFFIFFAYFWGAIPFGFLISKSKGIDIREHGSKNIGATNVYRVLGKKYGITVFILDFLKGFIPVFIYKNLDSSNAIEAINIILVAIASIIGHNYTFWLKFKGGKGVATSAGAMIVLLPIEFLGALLVWVITFFTTRLVALASIFAGLSLPIFVWIEYLVHNNFMNKVNDNVEINFPFAYFYFTIILALLAIVRHRSNIFRIFNKTEYKFKK